MNPPQRRVLCAAVFVLLTVGFLQAQENRCASCHFDRLTSRDRAEQAHLDDWDTSAHAGAGVGCEACHRGDPEALTLAAAHRDVLSPDNPASPVHARNIPETCGGCHVGQLDGFVASRHDQLLSGGDTRAPSCTTCHGAVAARLPSTRGISNRCALCHGPGGLVPISDHHELVRTMRDSIQEHRYSLALVRAVIEGTSDPTRRADLTERYDAARSPLADAVAAWHEFDFERAGPPLERADERIRALLDQLIPD